MTTEILCCSIVELAAISRAAKGSYQEELLAGRAPWGGGNMKRLESQFMLIERLRAMRGLRVIHKNNHLTIRGSLTEDGFCMKF